MPRIAASFAALFVAASAFAEFSAGIAVRVVTPDPLLPVSGGMGTPAPVKETRGDLTVRALVIDKDGEKLAIVAADFIGFPRVHGDKARALVKGIPADHILIGSTHTHSAPDMYGLGMPDGSYTGDLDYMDYVCTEMGGVINDAIANLRPAALRVASGKAEGKIAYNYYAPALYDPRCNILQFVDPKSKEPFATLVNYAIHPEVLGKSQGFCSPDLCGPLYDRIEAKGGGTCIFMNGAQGGMVTADCRGPEGKDIQTWDECIRIGNLLADEALRIVADAPVQSDPVLRVAAEEVRFPVSSELMISVVKNSPLPYKIDDDNGVTTQMNLVNLGNAQILTIPGEALPNIGYYLKRNMKGEHNFLFGLTNDAFGYILTKEDFGSFERYEYVSETSLGEETAAVLEEEALKLVAANPAPQSLESH